MTESSNKIEVRDLRKAFAGKVVLDGVVAGEGTPAQVAEGMLHLAQGGDLAYHVSVSVYRQMAGFLLAAVVGVPARTDGRWRHSWRSRRSRPSIRAR